jgi:2-dehydro-3-deoxygalactonokinase
MVILAVDTGTTSTRVYVVEDARIRGEASGLGGARDLAQSRDRVWLEDRVWEVAESALRDAGAGWADADALVGFGMITSELGLQEVPHLDAPVVIEHLARSLEPVEHAERFGAPFFLIPGVRSLGSSFHDTDFMRGEETEVAGLVSARDVAPPFLLVSPGSHTKCVILADLIDPNRPLEERERVAQGAALVEEIGFARALFTTRLLNRVNGESPGACSDLVHGIVAMADLLSLRRVIDARGRSTGSVVLTGESPLASAYEQLLTREAWVSDVQHLTGPIGAQGAWHLYTSSRRAAA